MGLDEKKRLKAAVKVQKKNGKTAVKLGKSQAGGSQKVVVQPPKSSRMVRFAEAVRGVLFVVFGVSLVVAVVLSQSGYVVTTIDIINSLISNVAGKIVLVVIAIAFLIYGLKSLRAIK